jgi:plasmid stability protein
MKSGCVGCWGKGWRRWRHTKAESGLLIRYPRFKLHALTIKNIPELLFDQLKSAAELHRRSINSEVLICIEQALIAKKSAPSERLKRIEQFRASISANSISLDNIDQAIENGRP